MKIVVADDDPMNRKYLRTLFSHEGHEVIECEDGAATLACLEENPCDAIISDILMPRMDGYRLCHEVRKSKKFSATPIILYSATYLSSADEKAALSMGADKFLRKPAQPEAIIAALNEAIESARHRHSKQPKKTEDLLALREYSEVLVRKLEATNVQLSVANEALSESEERLRLAASAGNIGMWEWTPATDKLVWSDQQKLILGFSLDCENLTMTTFLSAIFPEDRLRLRQALETAVANRSNYETEYRVRWPDKSVHWISSKGRGYYDEAGRCVRVVGAALDITRRKEADEALRKNEARFREMADNAPVMIWQTGADGLCTYLNKQWHDFTGQAADAGLGFGWLDAVHPDDRKSAGMSFLNANEHRTDFRTEYRVRRHDAAYRWVIDSGLPRTSANGEFLGYMGTLIDITEHKQAEEARQRHLERVRALHEINLAITSTMNRQSQLEVLLEKIETYFAYPTVSTLRLFHQETGRLESLAHRGLNPSEWRARESDRTLHRALRVVETKAPVIIADIHNDALKSDRALPSSFGLASYAGVPLIARDQVIGVLGVYSKEYHAFNDEEVEFLMTLAGQAAIAIQNAQLYEQAERRRREAEELARIGRSLTETLDLKAIGERVVSSVLNLFSVKGSTLRLRQPDGSMIRCAAAGEVFAQTSSGGVMPASFGLASRAFAVGKPIWCADMLKDPEVQLSADMREHILQTGNGSIITVPLRAHENLIGTLTLADRTGRSYSDSEIALLQTFAVQVALAVQNARHYEETQAHLKRIEALREIDQAITSTLDLQSVLDLLLEKIDVFLPFHAATTIRLYNRATGKFANVACRNIEEQGWKSQVGQGTGNLSRQLLTTKQPVIVANIQEDPQRAASQFYRQYGFISYLAVPLIAKDEVVGILGFYTKTPHTFTQQEVDLLLTLAGQAAMAIQNAQLYEEIDRSRKELETTNASLETSLKQLDSLYTALSPIATTASTQELMSGIIDRVMEATGADAALIRVGHSDGDLPIVAQRGFSDEYLTRVEKAPPAGSVAWVLENGEPIITPDIAAEPRLKGKVQLKLGLRSCAILPVSVHGEARGILHVASRNLGCFNNEQRNHLMAIARQMSIAMENRELFDSVRASRDELAQANAALQETNRMLSALHAVAAAASQSINLNRVLDHAIEKVTEIFSFEATRIHLTNEQSQEVVRRAAFEKNPERFTGMNSFKKGSGIIGRVIESGQSMIFEDIESDPRYSQFSQTKVATEFGNRFFAAFPIRSKLRILGAISFLAPGPRKLLLGEIQLIEAIADQLAVAIENTGLYEAVSQQVDELQRKTTELENANRVKDDFLSVVSHELRTPINVIMGYTSLFRDGVFGEIKPAQEDALAKIGRESADLLALINSVLYASTLETGQTATEIQEFTLESLLAELRDNYAVTAPPHLAIHWNYPAELPPLNTDRRKLRQILDNIIGNAVKFTAHGQVTVTVAACGASTDETESGVDGSADGASRPWIEFRIVDTGVGMSPDALLHIFDKFYQADSSETRSYGGVGMGLYIAKKFTELLQGSIGAESIAGQGSTFALRIPISLYCSSDSLLFIRQ